MKRLLKTRSCIFICMISLFNPSLNSQVSSQNGSWITPEGDLRILLIFAEINYLNSALNATTNTDWPQGQLPVNATTLFDDTWSGTPTAGSLTDYYYQMSGGTYRVVADVLTDGVSPFVVNESGFSGSLTSHWNVTDGVIQAANNVSWQTNASLSQSDFDYWTDNGTGIARSLSSDGDYDFIMVFIRNFIGVTASAAFPGFGLPTDLHSMDAYGFICFNTLTFDIIKHEFGHFLLGGNDFHSMGGHDNTSIESFFIPSSCGWGPRSRGHAVRAHCLFVFHWFISILSSNQELRAEAGTEVSVIEVGTVLSMTL